MASTERRVNDRPAASGGHGAPSRWRSQALRRGALGAGLVTLAAGMVAGAAWALAAGAPARLPATSAAARAQAGLPIAWLVDGMQRVGRQAPAGDRRHLELQAARGEYEPFQIVIKAPPGGLEAVDVVAGPLRGPDGFVIAGANLTLYREHYVRVATASASWPAIAPLPAGVSQRNASLGAGLYPEPLIPFVDPSSGRDLAGARLDAVPFALEGGKNQPIWVDVFVPRDAPPGAYTGDFEVTSAQGATSVSVTLRVWNFELPLRPSLASDFDFWNDHSEAAARELLKHKLMPHTIRLPWLKRLARAGLRDANVGFWADLDYQDCQAAGPSMAPVPPVATVRERVRRYGPGVSPHAFFADEIEDCRADPALAAKIRRYARALQRGGATPLLTTYPYDEYWIDGRYIWALLPKAFEDPAGIARARAAGQEIWSYAAAAQDNYSPKWLLDYAPINLRIQPGFISQSLGLTGLFYWTVDYWGRGNPWNDVTAFGPNYPGEGVLVYPGATVGIEGVAPGMRLKWLREGIEDYEYVELLKKRGQEAFALDVVRQVAASFKTWTRSTDALYAARKRLGDRLDELSAE